MIAGNVAKQIVDAIVDGYDADSLARALYFQMNLRITDYAPASDTFPTQVLKVVQWADRGGRLSELIDAAQVIRPRSSPTPEIDFGMLEVVTADHNERRLYTVLRCDVVILIGGHRLSLELARWALISGVPLVPLGKGTPDNASVALWHQVHNKSIDNLPIVPIGRDDLSRIGPEQEDLSQLAKSAVEIAARLGHEYRSSVRKRI